jgi:hypothetical protein
MSAKPVNRFASPAAPMSLPRQHRRASRRLVNAIVMSCFSEYFKDFPIPHIFKKVNTQKKNHKQYLNTYQ